jgi:hypothetical protein
MLAEKSVTSYQWPWGAQMLANEVVVPVAADEMQVIKNAALRLSGLRQNIQCAVAEGSVSLTGPFCDEDLMHRWRIALLNERLHQDARGLRSAMLAELIA